jgi:hypothetical protein
LRFFSFAVMLHSILQAEIRDVRVSTPPDRQCSGNCKKDVLKATSEHS